MEGVRGKAAPSHQVKKNSRKTTLNGPQELSKSTASKPVSSRKLKPISETARTTNGSTRLSAKTLGTSMKGVKLGVTGSVYGRTPRKTPKMRSKTGATVGKKKLFQAAAVKVWASVAMQRKSSLKQRLAEEASDSEEDNYYVIPRSLLRKLSLLTVSGGHDGRKRLSITMLNEAMNGAESGIGKDDDHGDSATEDAADASSRRRFPSLGSLVGLMVFRELHNKKCQAEEEVKKRKTKGPNRANAVHWDATVEDHQKGIRATVDSSLPEQFSASLSHEGQFATFRCYEDKVVAQLSKKDPKAGLLLNRPRTPPRHTRQTTLVTANDLREAIDLYDDLQGRQQGPVSRRTRQKSRQELPSATAYKKLGGIWSRQHGSKTPKL